VTQEERARNDVIREFVNGKRVIFFASDQVKASPRARHAQEIRDVMQPQNLPRKHAPAVASVISEVEVQVPLQGLVDDGFGRFMSSLLQIYQPLLISFKNQLEQSWSKLGC
jgi:hypothetical protein